MIGYTTPPRPSDRAQRSGGIHPENWRRTEGAAAFRLLNCAPQNEQAFRPGPFRSFSWSWVTQRDMYDCGCFCGSAVWPYFRIVDNSGTKLPAIVSSVAKLIFEKILDLPDLPADCSVVRVASDWFGQPLILVAEGRPSRPDSLSDYPNWLRWRQAQPRAHRLIYVENGVLRQIRFEDARGISTVHVQPIEDGWLVGESRGLIGIYDRTGVHRKSLDLGDASEDVQTTPDGRIWVSYFDEGVFGGTIAKQGVVCFDPDGAPLFRYADFAEKNELPFVADCYAMNAASSGDVWLNYYMEFPLVHIVDGVLEKTVLDFGCVGSGFAVRDGHVLYSRKGKILTQSIMSSASPEVVDAYDTDERPLVPLDESHVGFVGRGSRVLLNTGRAIYGLA